MSIPDRITSLANDRVKALVRLRNRRERDRSGLFLIEEPLVIARARAAGQEFREVWACPEQMGPDAAALRAELAAAGVPVVEVTAPVMAKVSYREKPEGLLVVATRKRLSLKDLNLPPDRPPLLVVLEAVEKPGNLGAVLRIADGAGADAVICTGGGVDLDNPNGLRASRGAYFTVPSLEADPAELTAWLREHGIPLLAADPSGGAYWDDCDLAGPVALVLGAEHDGLSPAMLAAADRRVTIPMAGAGDSLNVATAAAVLLYEAARQRRGR